MALMAPVENGKIVETDSQNSLKKPKTSNDGMDKEAFLQLLVAQMRYQDPLEPTSNTEYISQYAQFSQVEQLQNMAGNMELLRASSMVGQEVYVETTTSSGDSKVIKGKVDYVVYENSKAYLAINEELYSLDDLVTVADAEYLTATDKAINFVTRINKLPNVNGVDYSDVAEIDDLEKIYNEMTDYEKTFVASDKVKALEEYVEKAKTVKRAWALQFVDKIDALPATDELTVDNAEEVNTLKNLYDKMSDYEKEFVDEEKAAILQAAVDKVAELSKGSEADKPEGEE
ncbi:MAG: flagellar hook capping protein [Lachnoclostridium sp.]|nr:flagellar hook capping protein [Lachnospira sp.]MCM1246824.1 flagellar hook capping protein [Lachnoclostridium sp.]MCM1535389.1 flagellar hook capping protein [Clostridium sp.]